MGEGITPLGPSKQIVIAKESGDSIEESLAPEIVSNATSVEAEDVVETESALPAVVEAQSDTLTYRQKKARGIQPTYKESLAAKGYEVLAASGMLAMVGTGVAGFLTVISLMAGWFTPVVPIVAGALLAYTGVSYAITGAAEEAGRS